MPHTAVALGVIHCEVVPSHMFYAANASLVGLCCLAEKVTSRGGPVLLSQAPICPCVGFGTYAARPVYDWSNQYVVQCLTVVYCWLWPHFLIVWSHRTVLCYSLYHFTLCQSNPWPQTQLAHLMIISSNKQIFLFSFCLPKVIHKIIFSMLSCMIDYGKAAIWAAHITVLNWA